MMYLKTNNHRGRRRTRVLAGVSGVVVVLTILIQAFAPHFLPALFTGIAEPFWRAEFSIRHGSLSSREALLNQNEDLKRQLEESAVRSATVAAVSNENTELKTLLGRPSVGNPVLPLDVSATSTALATTSALDVNIVLVGSPSAGDAQGRILAPVLMRPVISPYDTFIIDGGADIGFSVGDRVYVSGNVLVGTIADVLDRTSKVVLYSSPGEIHQVMIGLAAAPATAIGRGGGQYSASLPHAVPIKEGDVVISPSLDTSPFGIVGAVVSDPTQAFQTVLFAPPVNVYEVKWVLVEKRK